ncbi:MAG: hypothetical protein M0022_02120 [Desulfobacteraceae bacterium]|nr:hypothetical protein [Desulfobacteraceae bacterium]
MSKYEVLPLVDSLKIIDALTLGEILSAKGIYSSVHSARVQAQKALNALVDLGKLERGAGYYRTPDCKSEYGDHSRLLTKSLAELFKHGDPVIFREHTITEIALRPDALVLMKKKGRGLCFVLEVCHTETPEYLQQKVTAWRNWDKSLDYLSGLFGVRVPGFAIVVAGDNIPDGCWEFNRFIKEVVK